MEFYGISGKANILIKSSLQDRHQRTLVDSINQFISFSINPLQGVHHMDIEMVEKYIYKFRSDLYNFQCHTLYKKQLIK
jgi:hypothetical protein